MLSPYRSGVPFTITGPTGAVAVLNDPTSIHYVAGVAGDDAVTGLDSPEIRENAEEMVEAHGGVHGIFYYGRRPVTLTGKIVPASDFDRAAKQARLERAVKAMAADATMRWNPGGTKVLNLVPNARPEVNTTNWTTAAGNGLVAGGTLTTETDTLTATSAATWASKVAKVVTTATADAGASTGAITLVAGTTYRVRTLVRRDAGGSATDLVIRNDATSVETVLANAAAPASGAYTLLEADFTAATSGVHRVLLRNDAATVTTFRVAGVQVVATANDPGAYTDGGAPGATFTTLPYGSTTLDGETLFTRVRAQQPLRLRGTWVKDFFVAFVAEDPRIYSDALVSTVIVPTGSATAGRSYDRSYDVNYQWAPDRGGAFVLNNGNADAPARYTFLGPMTNPAVQNLTAEREISLAYTLLAGEKLEVDTASGAVTFISSAGVRFPRQSALSAPRSFLFGLEGGRVTDVRLLASTYSGAASLTIDHRHTYL